MDKFYVKPSVKGADIRDPMNGDRMPDEGAWVERTPYWLGLEIRGDIVETKDPEQRAAERAEERKAKAAAEAKAAKNSARDRKKSARAPAPPPLPETEPPASAADEAGDPLSDLGEH